MTRAMSADGRWAYTLYDRGGEAPFIHALDTTGRTAACIDLTGFTNDDLSGMRLVVSGDGGTLSVSGPHGPVALVDMRTFAVRKPAPPRPRWAPARGAAAPAHGRAGRGRW